MCTRTGGMAVSEAHIPDHDLVLALLKLFLQLRRWGGGRGEKPTASLLIKLSVLFKVEKKMLLLVTELRKYWLSASK